MNREQRIDRVLNSLDGVQRAEANPFLYTKLQARLQRREGGMLPFNWSWRLAAVMLTIVLLNAATIYHFYRQQGGRSSEAAVIAQDYSLSLPETY